MSLTKRFDVVVIGGGIHGAGVAQAASAAGYSVLVLEQNEIASGTSSRSSKLIHGGLRYLESAQFSLVRECLTERTLLLKLAPDLVKLKPFYIPIYPQTSRRPWQIRAGLGLYATLGGLTKETRFQLIPKRRWETLDGLETDKLEKVFCYYDAQTDDALLTRAVMRSAQSLGAVLEMPAELIHGERKNDGYILQFKIHDNEQTCDAGLVINAAGPWVNRVLRRVTPEVPPMDIDLVQGTHIILEEKTEHGIYYVEAPTDKRAVFVMPWQGKTMAGTTETVYQGDPAEVKPLGAEKEYLCQTLAHYFPKFRSVTPQDISTAFAGLRVLPKTSGRAFSRPRDTFFHTDDPDTPRFITIYGGKLTAYRATAEKLIQQFKNCLPQRKAIADTRTLKLNVD